jgi:hypothetical protein
MDIFMIALLMDENKNLYDENVKLKARLYDLEHPIDKQSSSGIDWSVFDMTWKGGEKNHGDNELVDGFGAERGDYAL